MTDVRIAGSTPIIGQQLTKYWVGDRSVPAHAAVLELAVTGEQAAHGFGQYVHQLTLKKKGLPPQVYFPWVFTSYATEKLHADCEKLRKENEALSKRVTDLEDRLASLEEA